MYFITKDSSLVFLYFAFTGYCFQISFRNFIDNHLVCKSKHRILCVQELLLCVQELLCCMYECFSSVCYIYLYMRTF